MGLEDKFRHLFEGFGEDSVMDQALDFIIDEIDKGRTLEEIMNTDYIKSRLTQGQKDELLANPEVAQAQMEEVRETFKKLKEKGLK